MSAATGFVRTSVATECPRRRAVPPAEAAASPTETGTRATEHARVDAVGTEGSAESEDPVESAESADAEREQLAARVEELSAEVGQLRQALETRPVIDQARGMVMALAPCDADTAWQVLVRVSQHSNVKLRSVAAALVAGAEGTPVPKPVRKNLAAALHGVRTTRG
ncbi:ANTAR domain-containing protein [Streptomyces smyrnaeus]|uniref:ANTAR domain-containing protein n=1 Tax=Streptomyces TaxID=1883 RepID=UPI00161697F1|nr:MULTISPECIES: ANTAR domain-containing protein [unclassified Streptomyces]MBQ0868182.1 ANTAR domain-containing protein [Streptomyces sp. RK75]MBQ1121267.1 ANTAR domain-containing protein [Streptomyces sp. B15]MBQ1161776.1 ANTAR domain-containing protein [Streptomyces sp. A73]